MRSTGFGLLLATAAALAGCFGGSGPPAPRGTLTIHNDIQDAQDRGDYAAEALLQAELTCKTSGDCGQYNQLWQQQQAHRQQPRESGSGGGNGGGEGGGHAH